MIENEGYPLRPPPPRHQPPPTANHQSPPTATNCQPPIATNRHQPPTTNRHQLPPTANRQSPPTMGERMSYTRSFCKTTVLEHCFFLLKDRPGVREDRGTGASPHPNSATVQRGAACWRPPRARGHAPGGSAPPPTPTPPQVSGAAPPCCLTLESSADLVLHGRGLYVNDVLVADVLLSQSHRVVLQFGTCQALVTPALANAALGLVACAGARVHDVTVAVYVRLEVNGYSQEEEVQLL